jgi:hypothetical protein
VLCTCDLCRRPGPKSNHNPCFKQSMIQRASR